MNCPICYNSIQKKKTLVCGHKYCEQCIEKWELISNTCPVCRDKISNKVCQMCKFGCFECRPSIGEIFNNISDSINNSSLVNNLINDSLQLLEVYNTLALIRSM